MSASDTTIFVKPDDIWKYFQDNREKLKTTMIAVAQSDLYDVTIYLSDDSGLPTLIIESSNVESEEFSITDEESCMTTASMVYDLYLTEQIVTVMMQESENSEMEEREADIDGFILRLLEDLLSDDPILYSDLIESVVQDCKEHFLEYLYRKHGLSVYRPMELEDDEGVFVEDYPYECMEFDPNPLYDDKK